MNIAMATEVQFDRSKLKAAILHICRTVPADRLGAVKLHKSLYFTDMLRYAETGRAVTGATYKKRPNGPTCVQLLPVLAEMERDGLIEVGQSDYFGFRKTNYVALADPERGRLAVEEVALLDEVTDFVCNRNSARTISEFSHQLPWELAEFGEVIGYETALMLLPSEPSVAAFSIVSAEARAIEDSRSRGDAVARSTYRDFRSRVQSAHPRA